MVMFLYINNVHSRRQNPVEHLRWSTKKGSQYVSGVYIKMQMYKQNISKILGKCL